MPRKPRPGLRAALLVAARGEFARAGFAGASLEVIAEQAGATKGAVYFLFRSKLELFVAAAEELRAGFEETLDAAVSGGGDPGGRLERLLGAYLGFHLEHPEYRRLLLIPSAELEEELDAGARLDLGAHYRRVRSRLREVLAEGVLAGHLRCDDPAVQAFVLLAALEGVLGQRNADAKDVSSLCDEDRIVEVLVGPLKVAAKRRSARKPPPPPEPEDETHFRPAF